MSEPEPLEIIPDKHPQRYTAIVGTKPISYANSVGTVMAHSGREHRWRDGVRFAPPLPVPLPISRLFRSRATAHVLRFDNRFGR